MSAIQLARQDGREFVGKRLVPAYDPVTISAELVIENQRRDRRQQAQTRGQQRLGNARGDNGQVRVLLLSDLHERVHDAPDGAEQTDKRRGRANRRKDRQPLLQRFSFFSDEVV